MNNIDIAGLLAYLLIVSSSTLWLACKTTSLTEIIATWWAERGKRGLLANGNRKAWMKGVQIHGP